MKDLFVEGTILDGRYISVSPLNHGSFGMVFLATDSTSGEVVAIKCLTKASGSNGHSVSTVNENDVELACHDGLGQHPNIVNLLNRFETDSHVYLVLEFCSMGDLYEAIRLGHGPLETENVREFMLQLVNAVDFMHSKGLYHRDLKPENIFLTQSGSLKLGDFGLATSDTWSYEASIGSDRYMAPEQYDPSDVGYSPAAADVWAIGICLLNILFSRNPFVTPTESDVLFADFARDSQSLFDIFPNMSQDTFEVLSHCMTIDPRKRSLAAVRDALKRAVSFTTEEESLDDFCTEDREVVPSTANREPLRTPSIQNTLADPSGAFPWSKALHFSPVKTARQLSAIADTESYTEELFTPSEKNRDSWYSVAAPSLASVLESLGSSVKSMNLQQPQPRKQVDADSTPMAGSLPIQVSNPIPAISSVFGKKDDTVSKSWSDLFDEDEENLAHEQVLEKRREHNGRTWSQESKEVSQPVRRSGLSEIKNASAVNSRNQSPHHGQSCAVMDGSNENDGFFFQDFGSPTAQRYSPPPKRNKIMDKWADLGNRRRAYHVGSSVDTANNTELVRKRSNNSGSWRAGLGLKVGPENMSRGDSKARRDSTGSGSKVFGWRRSSIRESPTQQRDEDTEWVGGWHDLHL